jgi:hypothetical protein
MKIKMKKSILKNLVLLSFAFGALFLIGSNLNAQDVLKLETEPSITCSRFAESGRCNDCWEKSGDGCTWTGYQKDKCCI